MVLVYAKIHTYLAYLVIFSISCFKYNSQRKMRKLSLLLANSSRDYIHLPVNAYLKTPFLLAVHSCIHKGNSSLEPKTSVSISAKSKTYYNTA
jgi:hypothetical protein